MKKAMLCLLIILLMALFAATAMAQNTMTEGTTWAGGTWSAGHVPLASEDAVISAGLNVTISSAAVCKTLSLANSATQGSSLTINASYSMTVNTGTGAVAIGTNLGSVTTTSTTTLTVAGTLTCGNITMTGRRISGISANAQFTISNVSAAVTVTGGITMDCPAVTPTCDINFSAAGTLKLTGDFTNASTFGTLHCGTGTIEYNGADQSVCIFTYYNLTLSNSGTKTAAGAITTGGLLTIGSGVTLTMGANALTLNGGFTNTGTYTSATNLVTIGGSGTGSIGSFTTTGGVTSTKSGGTATLTSAIGGGPLTTNGIGGTLNLGAGLIHQVTNVSLSQGTLDGGSSTLKVSGTWTIVSGSSVQSTSTVDFNAAGPQTLPASSAVFNNLTLSGSGVKTLGTNTTVNGTLTMGGNPSATLALGGFTLSYGSSSQLIYNGLTGQNTGPELPATMGYPVTINNSLGVKLKRSTEIDAAVTLTLGILNAFDYLLTVGSTGSFIDGKSSSYVYGTLIMTTTAGASPPKLSFPSGSSTAYRPVDLTVTPTVPGETAYTLDVIDGSGIPSNSLPGSINKVSTVRYWQLSGGNINSASIKITYGLDDGVNQAAKLTVAQGPSAGGGNWVDKSGTATGSPSGSIQFTTTDLSANRAFILANLNTGTNPLPVQMTSFVAQAGEQKVQLSWTTATEVNNYGFDVERRAINSLSSTNAQSGWAKIGFVNGKGTSNSPKEYSYTDANVSSGTYAYCLKQIDNDGTYKYSGEAEVTLSVPKAFALNQNYPNPFNPSTTIDFTLADDGFTTLKVYDILGKEVETLANGNLKAGVLHQATFNSSKLSSGMYFYRLECGKQTQVKKLLLMK